MISVRHEVFWEVARSLNFSKAADVLCMSQPAISKHVKALEDYYKTALFKRKGNGIELTKAGELLWERLQEAKLIENRLELELSTIHDQHLAKGWLKLGASTTVALYILPKIISAFHQKYPNIKISLLNRNTETITKALLDGEINLGIVEGKNKLSSISYQPFLSDEVIAVCSAHSPLAGLGKLQVQQIKEYPVVLREQGSGTLAAIQESLAQKHGIKLSDLTVNIRMAGTEALKNFLKEDTCLGFLPKRSILRELKSGELVEIKIDKLHIKRDFYFIRRQGPLVNDLNKVFVRFAQVQV
jgi:DNA-binding transcriptional LysR family regulator